MYLVLLITLGIYGLGYGCEMSIGKATWDFNYRQDTMIRDIYSFEECEAKCWSNALTCKGFTHQNQGVISKCFLFRKLVNLKECSTCRTGTVSTPLEGVVCNGEKTLGQVPGFSLEECTKLCLNTKGCVASTWSPSSLFPNQCFLFDSCNSTSRCRYCETGFLACIDLPKQCFEYQILDYYKRNVYHLKTTGSYPNSDKARCSVTTSDWKGESYYQFMNPAGFKIPDYFPGTKLCSAEYPGWVNGTHPTKIGIEKNVSIVFGAGDYYSTAGITNCGGYFVYNLKNSPTCSTAYCGTFH